ncbi:MAG: DNA polymerase III subunit delta [Candidatus Marinimicrobia bacterium]|nr:DNA polymerase III subunit delta [Candidatus Neomarinimicrobiota bacterium]
MKIKPDQLSKNLSNGLESLYFIFGPEILLVEQSLTLIKKAAKENNFSNRVRFDIDGLFPWDTINNEMANPSLFSEKRIIECRLTTGKIGLKGSKALTELVDTLTDDILLIISTGKLDMNQQKSKWFKALDKKGAIIQHWEVQNEHLVSWIINQMTQLGLKTNKEVAEAIAYCTEGNLLASMQEIQKLKIAYPDGHINADEFLNQIDQQSHYSVFGLIDAALKGDSAKVNKVFNSLVDEMTPPVIIISSLYREIKSLATMSVELKQNEPIEDIFEKHRVWQKRKPLISNALKKHPYQRLQKLLLSLGRIDRSLKGMDNLNVYDELRSVLITLSGKTQWTQ